MPCNKIRVSSTFVSRSCLQWCCVLKELCGIVILSILRLKSLEMHPYCTSGFRVSLCLFPTCLGCWSCLGPCLPNSWDYGKTGAQNSAADSCAVGFEREYIHALVTLFVYNLLPQPHHRMGAYRPVPQTNEHQ
jgi:hypothetical protein